MLTIGAPPEDFIWLTKIFTEGLQVVPKDVTVEQQHLANYPSASASQPALLEYLEEEVRLGHFLKVPISSPTPVRIHPISFIPKPDQPGKWRLITDVSAPSGSSINEIIPKPPRFRMVTIDDVFNRVKRNHWGGKIDIAHAFRNIRLFLDHIGHLAVRVGDFYYLELCLPFGFSWAPFIWCSFSDFIQRYMTTLGFSCVVYVDDFLCLGSSKRLCFQCMVTLLGVLKSLGLPVKPSKVVWPAQSLTFIGFLLNFQTLTVSIDENRKRQLMDMLQSLVVKKTCPVPIFEKLVGRLIFASQVIRGARTFVRRLLDTLNAHISGSIKISIQTRLDLLWWVRFLDHWNGHEKIHPSVLRPSFVFASDASNLACGIVSFTSAACHCWTPSQSAWHINIKELWSVYYGLSSWMPFLTGTNVAVAVDNAVVVSWLNAGTARSPQAMKILRKIFWILAKSGASLKAVWVSSSDNHVADAVSRLDFRSLFQNTGIYLPWTSCSPPPGIIHHLTAPSFPLSHSISQTFFQFLQLIRQESCKSLTTSYHPDMQNPQNVVDIVRGRYLFGFATSWTGRTPAPPKSSSCTLPRGCLSTTIPWAPSADTSVPSPISTPPWELRSLFREWNALRWPFLSKESAESLRRLLKQNSHSPLPFFSVLEKSSISIPTTTWRCGVLSWSASGDSSVPITLSPKHPASSMNRTLSSDPTFRSFSRVLLSKLDAAKQTNMGSANFSSPSLGLKVRSFVRSVPSNPSSAAYKLALENLLSPTPNHTASPIAGC